jgi:hypothetical protein
MAAGSTYTPLYTTTLGSAQSSYTFSSISGSYTDLRLIMNIKTSDAGAVSDLKINVNGDTSSGFYSSTRIYGSGSATASDRSSNQNSWNQNGVNCTDSTPFGNMLCDFQNYSNSTTYKTMLMRSTPASNYTMAVVCLWRNTNAITSITLTPASGGNINSGSTLTLYGIAAA